MKPIKSIFVAIAAISIISFAGQASAVTFGLDAAHTQIGFSVKHMVISNVKGTFDKFSGSFEMDDNNKLTSANANIDVASINTKVQKRDNHLRSPDFFDVKKFPNIKFVSKSVSSNGTSYTVVGDITIKNVTKAITLQGEMFGPIKGFKGETRLGFHLEGKVNRKDFNVAFHAVLETGGLVVGDEVTITLDIEGIKK